MNEYIFESIDYDHDPEWVIKDFFNSMNLQCKFMDMLPSFIHGIGCVVNDTYCSFPDLEDPDPECHFEGMLFGVWEGEIIVFKLVGFNYTRFACKKIYSIAS